MDRADVKKRRFCLYGLFFRMFGIKKKGNKPQSFGFSAFFAAASAKDQALMKEFFLDFSWRLSVGKRSAEALHADFEKGFMYYSKIGVPVIEAAKRMSPEKMGGFYARPPASWYPLDCAAKIYPLSMKKNFMSVFRLSIYLKEEVVPELLQIALSFTIKRFPGFAVTVKKGFFWHYLDSAKRRFSIEKEKYVPCRPLDISLSDSQAFRVLYFENRISVEFFHILTDATGGLIFLKTLAAEYLKLQGVKIPAAEGIFDISALPSPLETANAFPTVEKAEKASGFIQKKAVQMTGELMRTKPCRILHFNLDAALLSHRAKSRGVTVTAYLLGLMFAATKVSIEGETGSVNIQVPVNMRKFYPSETLQNFSLYCGVRLSLSEITTPEEILPEIKRQLLEKASKASLNSMARATVLLVKALSWVPLFIKNPVARLIYGFLGEKTISNTLSNIGVVTLPSEMASHVERFDFVLGTGATNRAYCSVVTFHNVATFSVSKLTNDPTFEEMMYRLFVEEGFTPEVLGSELYEG